MLVVFIQSPATVSRELSHSAPSEFRDPFRTVRVSRGSEAKLTQSMLPRKPRFGIVSFRAGRLITTCGECQRAQVCRNAQAAKPSERCCNPHSLVALRAL